MAMSVNGYIARENGDEDFLSSDNWREFAKVSNKAGCLIWGRRTYEKVITWDKKYLEVLANVKKIVVTRQNNLLLDKRFYRFASTPLEAINLLEKEGYKEVILTGGSTNNTSFAKEGLIDEILLNVETTIVGKGIHLFNPEEFQFDLNLLDEKKISKNIIQFHYNVIKYS